ncbi:MAG TPA: UbiA-like protein EboC [Flavitalea sp.]|nr:UbiA-like protein EboC [Flavitalea sp.]
MKTLTGYLRLLRPANIVTAVADILAGVAIASSLLYFKQGFFSINIIYLALSTAFLYGGGVVLNDVFDADLDKIERPERPIPVGLIKKSHAAAFGMILLMLGIASAALCNATASLMAILISIAAVVYDKWMKHHSFLGPLNMGICRGLNLLLGMSFYTPAIGFYWFIALVPVIYIFAITMISRGEVHGGKKTTMYIAALLYTIVIASILIISFVTSFLLFTLPFIALFGLMIFFPLLKAIEKPEGPRIGKAVKRGVISLIIMNAAWAAAFGHLGFALIILLLMPVSLLLARLFAVT